MAEDKLIWSELRRALMTRASVSEKDATSFLNAFQTQLIEALKEDKQVKINGLGTFRLQPVAPRKSVDISTGEEITIEGYNKIIFAPEAGLRELVEKVSEASSPAEPDPIQKLGVQAEEIVDILGELGQSPEKQEEPESPEEPEIPETPEEPEEQKAEEPEEQKAEEPEATVIIHEKETVYVPEPVYIPEPTKDPEPEPEPEPVIIKKKESHWFRNLLIILLILLLLLACAYYFLPRPMLESWRDKAFEWSPWHAQTEQVAPVEAENTEAIENQAAFAEEEYPEFDEIVYDQLIVTERMHYASRLAWMSYRFYGDKRYWPYLYDANKDHLDNPNDIDVGTPIRVPKLTAEQRDLNNERTRKHLEFLRKRAEKAMR
ncbi:MAG: HU family DNA-binding protein [Paludibacteraceae bacterium]|nr:HU family DNA-binding protein [Paludibacteraceae bacterium]